VKSTLEALPGVANIDFNAADRTADISVDPAKFKVEDAMAALLQAGFPADSAEDLSAGTATEEDTPAEVTEEPGLNLDALDEPPVTIDTTPVEPAEEAGAEATEEAPAKP
jgi:copper chaperone CopZ